MVEDYCWRCGRWCRLRSVLCEECEDRWSHEPAFGDDGHPWQDDGPLTTAFPGD